MNKEELLARKRELQELIKPLASKKAMEPKEAETLKGYIAEIGTVETQIEAIDISDQAAADKVIADKKAFDDAVAEQVIKTLAEKEPPVKTPGVHTDVNVTLDEADRPYKSFGEFLVDVVEASAEGNRPSKNLEAIKATGMSEGVAADGGFLVQTDFSSELLKRTYEFGELLNRIRKVPISGNANGLKVNGIDETSRASTRWGGIVGYWLAEAGVKTASAPKFRQIALDLKKVIALCYATDELLQDTTALESLISQGCSEELQFQVEDKIYNGLGAGTPLGIMAGPCLVSVTKETGQTADTIVKENIDNMWSRMWAQSRRNAVWLINQDIEPQLDNMSMGVGTGGVPVYLPPGGISDTPYARLKGRPVIPIEYAATLGDKGDIMLADLSQYLGIDKGGVQAASSIHVKFLYDESVFRFVYRFDGQPMWNSALTPYKGSKTLSPFVVLAAR